MKINELLSRLEKVKSINTNSWVACCPHHGDKLPSLAIKHDTSTGKILIKCWAGCGVDEIMAAIGMNMADLFPDDFDYGKRVHIRFNAETIVKGLYHDLFTLRSYAINMNEGLQKKELNEVIKRLDEALTYIEPSYMPPVPSWGKK
jgi:hypothetical protein